MDPEFRGRPKVTSGMNAPDHPSMQNIPLDNFHDPTTENIRTASLEHTNQLPPFLNYPINTPHNRSIPNPISTQNIPNSNMPHTPNPNVIPPGLHSNGQVEHVQFDKNLITSPGSQNRSINFPGIGRDPNSRQNLHPQSNIQNQDPSTPNQNTTPMPEHNFPPMSNHNMPRQMHNQNLPAAMVNQNIKPMQGQNPPLIPGQQNTSPVQGQVPLIPSGLNMQTQNINNFTEPQRGLMSTGGPPMSGQVPPITSGLNMPIQNINNFNEPQRGAMPSGGPPMPGQAPPQTSNMSTQNINNINEPQRGVMPTGGPPMPGRAIPGQNISSPPPMNPGNSPLISQNNPVQQIPPLSQQPPVSGQHSSRPMPGQFNRPPMPGQPGSQFNQPPIPGQPGNQFNQPPMPGQPGNQFNQPPMPGQPGNQFNQPPSSGQPSNQFTRSPMPGQQTNQFNQPPMPGPTNKFNQPPMPGPGNQFGQPPLPGPATQFNRPPMPGPGTQFNQPPMPGSGNQFNQPPMPGPTNKFNQPPPMPGQPGNQFNQPPMPGQPGHQFGQPPMPGPPGNQFNQPPMPGPPGGQFNQPPVPGVNQLSNQVQGMNLGGNYPGNVMNGDNGPHMPPPLSQGYASSPQSRQGYPPMPGQGGLNSPNQYPSQQNYQQQQQQQQQQQRRLDPDQMPSPIQVVQDDQANRSGVFCTNQKGLVPPLVSTKFVVQDQGFASPRFMRSTMYNVPVTNDLIKQTAVPFGLVISPMARLMDGELSPPIVNFNELGPVRCIRCKAYMCPFMQFIDSGRRFQCLFCKASTDVPAEYFQHLDVSGQRLDKYERPELVLGTYEFVATSDYCRNNTAPKPPAIIFVIDVSYNNVKSGLVHLLCSQMKDIIKNLPIDEGHEKSNMKVGFITYNSTVHFYNIKGNLAAPQMLVVGDTQEMFMPLLDGFLCTPEESEPVIDALMEQIPRMFADTRECETILMPAIVAGLEALKASECTGKLLVFHSTLPITEAPGKLKNRDDRKLLGTEKERTILTPQNQVYNQLGQDCVGYGCSVDLFLFNNAYIDVATIGQVCRLSGGEVYKYTYFQADIDGERVINDIVTNISRPIAFDAIMRVRTSTGVRPTDFYGHCFMSNTTDVELASIDCDKALAVEIKHDDKLQEDEGIYIQVALLYTSVSGQRRLRIINQALKTCTQMTDLYRSCDLETIINFISKQAVYKLLDNNPKAVKDGIVQRAAQMLANYRKNCASPSSAGQLILPECMKLLPLYVNCLMKSDAMSGGADMTVDDRSFIMQAVMTMDVPASVSYFYPRLIPLHEVVGCGDGLVSIPPPIRCTVDKMTDQGVYILENGIHMFLWIGLGANQEFVQQVFGAPSAVQVNIENFGVPELKNPLSEAVTSIIEQIRAQRHRYMRLSLVRQKEKLEVVFKHFLVEDRGLDSSPGYVDFLCHMHKEIRNLLS